MTDRPSKIQAIAEYERRHRRKIILTPERLSIESIDTGEIVAEIQVGDDETVLDALHRVIGGDPAANGGP